MHRLTFALLFLAGVTADDCNCAYLDQPPPGYKANDWPTFYIQNPLDQVGQPCKLNCTYLLDSGDNTKGIGDYSVYNWDEDGDVNYISIYNCDINRTEDTANPLVFHATKNSIVPPFQSTGEYVCVFLNVTKPVNILVAMSRTAPASSAAPPKTTTSPAPTTTYNKAFNNNPSLVSNDVMFMVDGGANGGKEELFSESKVLAATIVNTFNNDTVYALNSTRAPTYGSRMALRYLTNVNYQNIGTPWNVQRDFVSNQIRNLFQIQNTNTAYLTALNNLLSDPNNSPFSLTNTPPFDDQNARPTAQRLLIIVASSKPSDLNSLVTKNTKSLFVSLDVHPIFIAYGLDDETSNSIKSQLYPFWGFKAVKDIQNLTNTVDEFFNEFLLDATEVCNVNTSKIQNPSASLSEWHYPSNYEAKKSFWSEDHQKGRYCNFQHVSFKLVPQGTNTITQFNVTYELEAGKDFLTFSQDDGNGGLIEIASLSGADIGPSTFYTNGNVTVEFTTNESQVFGGFSISYKTVDKVPPLI